MLLAGKVRLATLAKRFRLELSTLRPIASGGRAYPRTRAQLWIEGR